MSNNDIKRINKDLANDFLPVELDFTMKPTTNIDWEKVAYNTFYKSQDYFINKFPQGFESLPGYKKIIDELMCYMEVDLKVICDSFGLDENYFEKEIKELDNLRQDGLVRIKNNVIKINLAAPQIARVVCSIFDKFFKADSQKHSKIS